MGWRLWDCCERNRCFGTSTAGTTRDAIGLWTLKRGGAEGLAPPRYREVAQPVERRPYKPCDVGSSPTFPTMRRLHHAGPRKGRVYLADPRSPRGLPCRTLAGSIPASSSQSMTGGMYGAEGSEVWQVDLLRERRGEGAVEVQSVWENLQTRSEGQEVLLELRQPEHEGELIHEQQ